MMTPGGGTSASYPQRKFVAEEKCWVTGIQVQKDGIVFQLYSDPYNDIRYYGNLKITFPNKKEVPPVDAALQLVAEVLAVVPQDDQASQAGPPATDSQAAAPASDPLASIQGIYIRKDKASDSMELGPNGVFALVQNGRRYDGNYTVQGETLTVWGPKMRGQQKCSLVGNVITDPGNTIWEKPAAQQVVAAPAAFVAAAPPATPAPLTEIAPPLPPADAPPPTIALGQTIEQVSSAFGQPLKMAKLGAKEIFYYKDMKVTFTNGKVSNVE
jgi:hypothetical protein